MTGRDDAARYLNGAPGHRFVLVPDTYAAWLYDAGGLRQARHRHRGLNAELDALLMAFAVVSDEFRQRGGSAAGTKPVPSPEPAPGLNERVSVAAAAALIGISDRAVRKAAIDGRLSGERVDGRWRLDVASVRAYRDNRAA